MSGMAIDLELTRNELGQLVYTARDGMRHEGVVPVRAFPITAPQSGLAIVSTEGEELVWIEDPEALPQRLRVLLEEELATRDFTPRITCIKEVSSFATPSTWLVETDRGGTTLVLKGEEDIRRLSGAGLLIADKHGIHYLIRDMKALDKKSRRFLDRFL
ncbi:MAG: DUF1854 domain-containing protein [Gammaproteobacteria bacterium]|nr:DUF1854 domain-containing protein [Gammaproteobacteria bacterium]MBI5618721.1 DUF1854 domain-containing protein [Gammaproteobacteria bacterium]